MRNENLFNGKIIRTSIAVDGRYGMVTRSCNMDAPKEKTYIRPAARI